MKHPKVRPTRIEVPIEPERIGYEELVFNPYVLARYIRGKEAVMRREVGDYVNLFWPNLAHWSGMLWDPKRFPMMVYEMNKNDVPSMFKLMKENEAIKRAMFPWPKSLLLFGGDGSLMVYRQDDDGLPPDETELDDHLVTGIDIRCEGGDPGSACNYFWPPVWARKKRKSR